MYFRLIKKVAILTHWSLKRQVTIVFIDLRGSTTLAEMRMPYNVLFILNQFFKEMTKALAMGCKLGARQCSVDVDCKPRA